MSDQNPNEPTGEMVLDTDPLVENPAPDDETDLVLMDATLQGVVTITINRAAKKNAFNQEIIGALREKFESLHGADHVRVCFIRGAGGTFCAGADLEWMREAADWSESDNRDDAYDLARMLKALYDVPALTVAIVEGAAFGGGAGLIAACDMAVAVSGAKFAFSEVKLGLIPATISPYVVDAIGPRYAKALFCTGRIFDADFARQIGLVQNVLPGPAAIAAYTKTLIAEIMSAAPGAVLESKKLVWDVWGVPIDDKLMRETAHRIAKKRVGPEGQEGVRAFLDKRKPSWMQ